MKYILDLPLIQVEQLSVTSSYCLNIKQSRPEREQFE